MAYSFRQAQYRSPPPAFMYCDKNHRKQLFGASSDSLPIFSGALYSVLEIKHEALGFSTKASRR
jgi:hypothetical protein